MARLWEILGCTQIDVQSVELHDGNTDREPPYFFFDVNAEFAVRDTAPLRRALQTGTFGPYSFEWWRNDHWILEGNIWGQYSIFEIPHGGALVSLNPIQGWAATEHAHLSGIFYDVIADDGFAPYVSWPKRATQGMSMAAVDDLGSQLAKLAAIDPRSCVGQWTNPAQVRAALKQAKRPRRLLSLFG